MMLKSASLSLFLLLTPPVLQAAVPDIPAKASPDNQEKTCRTWISRFLTEGKSVQLGLLAAGLIAAGYVVYGLHKPPAVPTRDTTDGNDILKQYAGRFTLEQADTNKLPLLKLSDTFKHPIVYHPEYNINPPGMRHGSHPFDGTKYKKAYDYLTKNRGLSTDHFHTPHEVSEEDLLKVHTKTYIESLKNSAEVARISGVRQEAQLAGMPNSFLQQHLLRPMRLATQGTIEAAFLALEQGWSINISGGYHHACRENQTAGFCFYADIPLAAHKVWEKHPEMPIMIIDLDAHQGNGHEEILGPDKRVTILDMYNKDIYPKDHNAARFIDVAIPVSAGMNDAQYMTLLSNALLPALDAFAQKCTSAHQKGLIIYNAGTDILDDDKLGGFKVSLDGVITRDLFVVDHITKRGLPFAMVLSGGYSARSSFAIARSLEAIIRTLYTEASL